MQYLVSHTKSSERIWSSHGDKNVKVGHVFAVRCFLPVGNQRVSPCVFREKLIASNMAKMPKMVAEVEKEQKKKKKLLKRRQKEEEQSATPLAPAA